MATNSNITVPQKYATKYKNVVYGWDTSHPTIISKQFIILIYHYLHVVQLAWQLDTIRKNGSWQVGDSAHRIPGIDGPAPTEAFTAQWRDLETNSKPRPKKRSTKAHTEWKALAKQDVWIKPDAIATVVTAWG